MEQKTKKHNPYIHGIFSIVMVGLAGAAFSLFGVSIGLGAFLIALLLIALDRK